MSSVTCCYDALRFAVMKSCLPGLGHERPQLIIIDGHDSHYFVEVISIAIKIIFICWSLHLTHLIGRSQVIEHCLDHNVWDNNECHQLMSNYPGFV